MADPAGPMQSQKAGFPSLVIWLKQKLMADPAGPMQFWKTVFLFFYLVIAGLVVLYFVYGLWAAEPQAAQLRPAAEPSYPPAENPADGTPQIKLIDPQAVTIGTGQVSIRVLGANFTEHSRAATGRLSGIPPAAAAETSYTFQVTDKTGASATAELTLPSVH